MKTSKEAELEKEAELKKEDKRPPASLFAFDD